MDGRQEYDGGITVELKDTQEFAESKITKRVFDVSMEQVMVDTYACTIYVRINFKIISRRNYNNYCICRVTHV